VALVRAQVAVVVLQLMELLVLLVEMEFQAVVAAYQMVLEHQQIRVASVVQV
jgi:hypothetical protein